MQAHWRGLLARRDMEKARKGKKKKKKKWYDDLYASINIIFKIVYKIS
jgi:hypothetical protein